MLGTVFAYGAWAVAQNGLPDREVKENAKTTSLATHDLHIAVLGVDGQIAAGTWVTARAELEEVKATVLSDGTFACECSGNAAKLTVFHPVLGEVQLLLEIPSPLPAGISSLGTVPVVVQFKGPGVARLSIERFSGDGALPSDDGDPPAGGGGEGLGTCNFEVAASCQIPDNLGQGGGGVLAVISDINATVVGSAVLSADDFNIDGFTQVNEVCFWGVYIDFALPGLDCSPQVDNFTITYYVDNAGCPGAVHAGPFNVGIVGKAANGRVIVGVTVFEYTASHAAVFFGPGCYWISIQNDTTPGTCTWFWQSAPAGNSHSVTVAPGPFACPIAFDDNNDHDFGWCLGLNGVGATLGDPTRCEAPPPVPCDSAAAALGANCCPDRIAISDGLTAFDTTGATTDGAVPSCGGAAGGSNDIWYNYTATCTGDLTVTTCEELGGSATYDTHLVVYDGCACNPNDTELGCNDDDLGNPCGSLAGGFHSTVTVAVVSGNCYKIRVGGFDGAESGSGSLSVSCSVPPPPEGNDLCIDRVDIFDGDTPFDTSLASTDGPVPSCRGLPGGFNDIWYNYTATCTGELTLSTCNQADYDTHLVVYDGCACPADTANELGCNDDGIGCAGFTSELVVDVVQGQCYKIRVGGFDAGESGSGTLTLSCFVPPAPPNNDLCEDRRPAFNGLNPFDTLESSTDGGPASCGLGGSNDVWFNYNSDFTGGVTFTTCEDLGGSADFDTNLVVYDGCACPAVNELGCNDDDPDNPCGGGAGGFHSTVKVSVVAGQCYKIRLSGFGGADTGTGMLAIIKQIPRGGCCLPDRECLDDVTEEDCFAIGGVAWFQDQACSAHFFEITDCANAFEDIANNVGATELFLGDDDFEEVAIGFAFSFFKRPQDLIKVSSNGYLTFGGDGTDFSNDQIPDDNDPNDFIAPLWDDLNPSQGGTVHFQTLGAAGNQRFIAQWTNVPEFFNSGSNTFQAILFEGDNCIEFRYGVINPEGFVGDYTIGVENQDGTEGFSVAGDSVADGSCVSFCPFQVEIECPQPEAAGGLDIKPESCPNPFNCNSNGTMPVALLGTATFDVTQVDQSSLLLTRKDGVGGSCAPHAGPNGPNSTFADVGTPFDGDPQDPDPTQCCHTLGGDGFLDLLLHFRTADCCEALGLDLLADGTVLTLQLSGTLLDGTPFTVEDCIVKVPVGGAGDPLLSVESNVPGAWIDVTPMDISVDGGGFVPFDRYFSDVVVATLTAAVTYQGRPFVGWTVESGLDATNTGPQGGRTIQVLIWSETTVTAIYGDDTTQLPDAGDAGHGR